MKLRTVLQKYLDDSGLSASALAAKAKVPKATLLGWLAGKAPRDLNQLRAVARVTGMSMEQLVFDEPEHSIVLETAVAPSMSQDWQHVFLEVRYRPVKRSN